MQESPIFTRSYDLMAWLLPRTLGFPRNQRGVLARRLQDAVCNFHEQLVDASLADNPRQALRQADATLTKLRTYLRPCRTSARGVFLVKPRPIRKLAHLRRVGGRLGSVKTHHPG